MRRALRALTLVGALVATRPAVAFKEPGHRAIEAAAYRELLDANRRLDEATRQKGHAALETLLQFGALSPLIRPMPRASAVVGEKYDFETVDALALLSHMPDHHFDRQLQGDRQCFHFNARSGFVTGLPEPLNESYGDLPRGLVEDAYIECLGLADALLRNVIFDPIKSRSESVGLYELMHMIEDSFADSHVARNAAGKIVFVKPWNLRSGLRYLYGNAKGPPVWSHFSDRHHMTTEMRDAGYALGPYDDEYAPDDPNYRQRLDVCLREATKRLPSERDTARAPATLGDLQSEMVIPTQCLSNRALRAKDAVVALLKLVAEQLQKTKYNPAVPYRLALVRSPSPLETFESPGLEKAWLGYRCEYLAHVDRAVSFCPQKAGRMESGIDDRHPIRSTQRGDRVYFAGDLQPRIFRTAGAGLTTELRSGTPLWLGIDLFASRNAVSHHALSLFLDTLAWGIQVRLPLPDEAGEKPVGVAFDIGPGLPLPLSELFSLDELQIYAGLRGRAAYTAQSIFEGETRHSVELGFGGVSVDFVVGDRVWFGLDAPRFTYSYDAWTGGWEAVPTLFSFSGGIAVDAF